MSVTTFAGKPTPAGMSAPHDAAALTLHPIVESAGSVEHVFTHFSLTLEVHVAEGGGDDFLWTPPEEAAKALPTVFRKALERGLAAA